MAALAARAHVAKRQPPERTLGARPALAGRATLAGADESPARGRGADAAAAQAKGRRHFTAAALPRTAAGDAGGGLRVSDGDDLHGRAAGVQRERGRAARDGPLCGRVVPGAVAGCLGRAAAVADAAPVLGGASGAQARAPARAGLPRGLLARRPGEARALAAGARGGADAAARAPVRAALVLRRHPARPVRCQRHQRRHDPRGGGRVLGRRGAGRALRRLHPVAAHAHHAHPVRPPRAYAAERAAAPRLPGLHPPHPPHPPQRLSPAPHVTAEHGGAFATAAAPRLLTPPPAALPASELCCGTSLRRRPAITWPRRSRVGRACGSRWWTPRGSTSSCKGAARGEKGAAAPLPGSRPRQPAFCGSAGSARAGAGWRGAVAAGARLGPHPPDEVCARAGSGRRSKRT